MLMTFPAGRAVGTSILASAGIAGLVLGIAARPAVENLMAGLRVAAPSRFSSTTWSSWRASGGRSTTSDGRRLMSDQS